MWEATLIDGGLSSKQHIYDFCFPQAEECPLWKDSSHVLQDLCTGLDRYYHLSWQVQGTHMDVLLVSELHFPLRPLFGISERSLSCFILFIFLLFFYHVVSLKAQAFTPLCFRDKASSLYLMACFQARYLAAEPLYWETSVGMSVSKFSKCWFF